jgi:hypothetical protein
MLSIIQKLQKKPVIKTKRVFLVAIPKPEIEVPEAEPDPEFDVEEFVDKIKKPKKKVKIVSETRKSPEFKEIPRDARGFVNIMAPAYIMNNREKFISFITKLFLPYKNLMRDSEKITCDNLKENVNRELMIHQQIVRDYINLYTPYRGLLLYHGLGSGKTCSSISIAEGMKNQKQVVIMTPASLRDNYITQLKECGDFMYKLNQHWVFTPAPTEKIISELHRNFSIPISTITKNNGAWLVESDVPNYSSLTPENKKTLNKQIDDMISLKYKFISYNGINTKKWMEYNNGRNFFDNKVIVIDEAHNFISRIVNKLNSVSTKKGAKILAIMMYESLMMSVNSKIILLTGTPVVNYANEIGILFNILRGYIKTWEFKLEHRGEIKKDALYDMITVDSPGDNVDYYDYVANTKTLTVTENPFGFENKYQTGRYMGVELENRNINFLNKITDILTRNGINIVRQKVDYFKCLPDNLEEFNQMFINNSQLKNTNLLKKRIIGLTSYFKSAQEELMPKYEPEDFHVDEIYMSNYQFEVYEKARIKERQSERNAKKTRAKKSEKEVASTYRIFSRLFCNFVMPVQIERPTKEETGGMPKKGLKDPEVGSGEIDEFYEGAEEYKEGFEDLDEPVIADEKDEKDEKVELDVKAESVDDIDDIDDIEVDDGEDIKGSEAYEKRLREAFNELVKLPEIFTEESLQIFSPKYLNILKNITNVENIGLHLLYSQFRTIEGIGIFGEVLKANGFVKFEIKKRGGEWDITSPVGVQCFAFYSGTESKEEKEIVRKIFNGEWNTPGFPPLILEKLKDYDTNMFGEIIKVLMITASGSEGINLKNTRFVHIMEPYWNPARIDQVIGRARRICSHQQLPEELRTVEVFLYIMIFTEEQIKRETSVELRQNDRSKRDPLVYLTSDGALYEINLIKSTLIHQVTQVIKESAIDCAIHSKSEDLQCMNFGTNPSGFSTTPSYNKDVDDKTRKLNIETRKMRATEWNERGILYAVNEETGIVYDHAEYDKNNLVPVGKLRNGRILLD